MHQEIRGHSDTSGIFSLETLLVVPGLVGPPLGHPLGRLHVLGLADLEYLRALTAATLFGRLKLLFLP